MAADVIAPPDCTICEDPMAPTLMPAIYRCEHCDVPCLSGIRCTTCGGGNRGLQRGKK